MIPTSPFTSKCTIEEVEKEVADIEEFQEVSNPPVVSEIGNFQRG